MELRRDLPELRLRGFRRCAGRKTRVDVGHPMHPLVLHRRAHVVIVGRVVDVEILPPLSGVVRARSEHADDHRLFHGEIQHLSDDRRIRSEDAPPVRVGEDHDRLCALAFVLPHEHPSELRARAEHLEEVRAHQTAGRSMGLTPPQHVERPVAEFHELIDGLRLRSVIGHFEEREARVLDARGGLRLAQVHDAIGLGIGQRAQQHSIDHAEDGGVGADAQTQGQDEGE
jgi:hypothetical protein